jgi:16S rRNA (cytosine1402-N4)-methyltransferase
VPGDVAVDCTLGGGGHAQAILERVQPGGRLIGLDVDPLELPRAEARLRAAGLRRRPFVTRHGNFAGLPRVLAAEGLEAADVILADLGVSSMQIDNPGSRLQLQGARSPRHADESIACGNRLATARAPERGEARPCSPRTPMNRTPAHCAPAEADARHDDPRRRTAGAYRTERGLPRLAKTDVKMSVRRTFQALRIAVNDEFSALDALLRSLPQCLAPGGRVAC